jgi:hypothetical protein
MNGFRDAFFLFNKPNREEGATELPDISPMEVPVYVRFGYLLYYLNEYCLPKNKENNPPLKIDWKRQIPMYMPNQQHLTLSYNPSKYILHNPNHKFDTLDNTFAFTNNLYKGLTSGIDSTSISDMSFIRGEMIYCNISNLLDKIPIEPNDENETKIDIFGFLKDICTEINYSLGGVNNLEPVMDEDTNTLMIVDSTNFPKKKELLTYMGLEPPNTEYLLQLFGFRKFMGNKVASFVRNINLETKLSKETSTLITIGATAEGSSPGLDATAFSRINQGTKDRFATEFTHKDDPTTPPPTPEQLWVDAAKGFGFYNFYGYDVSFFTTPGGTSTKVYSIS